MSLEYPQDLRYLDSHEYVRLDDDIATIGVTQFAIDQLGDIVFLDLLEVGIAVSKGDSLGTIESVKAVETLNSPVSGTVIERNDALIESPEDVGDDPYGAGWFLKLRVDDAEDIEEDTMTADEYSALVEGE
ncbi:glycine cleavage system protein GcvH [Sphaerospermopsis aphanizomenoides BCCUSP55]|uniref:glycine cleavage system protein GcvH n=1 Tax=Sphaerospermopsis aphanizomenoides TaxID=459663 RepID=UPI000AB04475|nr:glycine cleavage system protein GcvH [Sphaerospermopsis aphanizomenoides]MBK1988818.1 glycine cleavage system protein GcvH [Sphaerospermopsis aphanizomenoides BCCUSP55]